MSTNLYETLRETLDDEAIGRLSQQINASPRQTRDAVGAALPTLLGMLTRNCESQAGRASLANAVQRDHSGDILNALGGFLKAGDTTPGQSILGHILGDRRSVAERQIASQSGLGTAQIGTLLALLAPIVMGALGRQARAQGDTNPSGIGDLLQGAMQAFSQGGGNQAGIAVLAQLLGGSGGKRTDFESLARQGAGLLGSLLKKN